MSDRIGPLGLLSEATKRFAKTLNTPVVWVLDTLLRIYQFALSPWIGNQCRFYPTCSCYARQALQQHGAIYGMWLAAARLARCHPFAAGGDDPVPAKSRLVEGQSVASHQCHSTIKDPA